MLSSVPASKAARIASGMRCVSVVEIFAGASDRFPDIPIGGKVDDGVNGILFKYVPEDVPIGDVALNERPPLHGRPIPGSQIVDGNGLKPLLRQILSRMAADGSGATRNDDCQCSGPPRMCVLIISYLDSNLETAALLKGSALLSALPLALHIIAPNSRVAAPYSSV